VHDGAGRRGAAEASMLETGFLGTRADFMQDLVITSLLLIVPLMYLA
jgi:hypothetical protein